MTGGILVLPTITIARENNSNHVFSRPELRYSFDALTPFIDEKTMRIHYDKHYKGYTDNLNNALANNVRKGNTIEDILSNLNPDDTALRNNGGGYYNHRLFFDILSPDPQKEPSEKLMTSIIRDFGSFEEFKRLFNDESSKVFGSGWAWLILQENGKLAISSTHNQDNPLMPFAEKRGTPLIGLDVWEHAYYLNYQNKRGAYIDAFYEILDWEVVDGKFNNLMK
ncbi:MAG: superoxide dismutase [Crocinitomicaceae bacterium]|nr:superoxide dismutase [Crocinitomicaceae bacterium]